MTPDHIVRYKKKYICMTNRHKKKQMCILIFFTTKNGREERFNRKSARSYNLWTPKCDPLCTIAAATGVVVKVLWGMSKRSTVSWTQKCKKKGLVDQKFNTFRS